MFLKHTCTVDAGPSRPRKLNENFIGEHSLHYLFNGFADVVWQYKPPVDQSCVLYGYFDKNVSQYIYIYISIKLLPIGHEMARL